MKLISPSFQKIRTRKTFSIKATTGTPILMMNTLKYIPCFDKMIRGGRFLNLLCFIMLLCFGHTFASNEKPPVINLSNAQFIPVGETGIMYCPYMFYTPGIDYIVYAFSEKEPCSIYVVYPETKKVTLLEKDNACNVYGGSYCGHWMHERVSGIDLGKVCMLPRELAISDLSENWDFYSVDGHCLASRWRFEWKEGEPFPDELYPVAKTFGNQYVDEPCYTKFPSGSEREVCDVVMYGKIYRAQENELVSVHENDITVLDSVENKTLRRYSCILSSDRCVFLWLSEASGEKQEGLIQNRWTVFFVNDKGAIEKKQNLPYNIKKKYAHYNDAIHTPQALARGVLLLVESSTSEKIYAYISPDNDEIVYLKSDGYLFALPFIFKNTCLLFRIDEDSHSAECGVYVIPASSLNL